MLTDNLDHEDKLCPRLLAYESVIFAIILFILQLEKQARRGVGRPTSSGTPAHVSSVPLCHVPLWAGTHDALVLKAELPGIVRTQGPEEVQKEGALPWQVADVF